MSSKPGEIQEIIKFGNDFELDFHAYELRQGGRALKLEPTPMDLLLLLLEQRGRVVTRDQIIGRIWGKGVFVDTDNSINGAIRKIRQVLKDDAEEPRYIQTVTGRGYRFIAPITQVVKAEVTTAQTIKQEDNSGQLNSPPAGPRQKRTRIWHRRWIWLSIAAAVLAAGLTAARFRSSRQPQTPRGRVMLAVLPFENLTGDASQEYFSDGLTEEIITRLASLDPQHLGVIARTSVMHYKNTRASLGQIGRELGIQYAVEGSVRRDSNRVRITSQLVQLADQTHLWAREYDEEIGDVLDIQSEIARSVAEAIQITTPESATRASSHRRVNPEAYEDYLRGLYFYNRFTPDDWRRALEIYKKALSVDPDYAPIHHALAETYFLLAALDQEPSRDAYRRAHEEEMKALLKDPTLPKPRFWLAYWRAVYEWEWKEAETDFERAFQSAPNDLTGHSLFAWYLIALGRSDQGLAEEQRARELDPLSPVVNASLGNAFYFSRQYDRALEQYRRTAEMFPNFRPNHSWASRAYATKGMFREAVRELQAAEPRPVAARALAEAFNRGGYKEVVRWQLGDLSRQARSHYVGAMSFALLYAGLKDRDNTIKWLEQAYAEHAVGLFMMNATPEFDFLHADPRYQDVLRRMGFPH